MTHPLGLARPLGLSRAMGTERMLGVSRRVGMRKRGDPRPNLKDLFDYQVEGVKWLRKRKHALLADDMGTGKTVQFLRALPRFPRAIVVCPSSVQLVWKKEGLKWRPDLKITVGEPLRLPAEGEVLVLSIDSLPDPPAGSRKLLLEDLSQVHLIGDEIHMAMNDTARRTRLWRMLMWQCGFVWGGTGTPMLGVPQNLWGVLLSLGLIAELFPTHVEVVEDKRVRVGGWKEFLALCQGKKRFTQVVGRNGRMHLKQIGYEWGTIDPEVQRRLRAGPMLRRLREDVLPNLPKRQYVDVPCEAPADLRVFLDAVKEKWDGLDQRDLPPFELLSEARAALARSRIPQALEHTRLMAASMPTLVFSAHREPIEAVGRLTDIEGGVATLMGETTLRQREELVNRFQAGELRVLAMTIDAGGVGLTLTRAGGMVFVDRDYTPAMNDQAECRAVRPGQEHQSVLVKRLVSDHPLDIRLGEILDEKQKRIKEAVG